MAIANTNPNAKDVVILQRDDTNSQYNETHISASSAIIYLDSDGHVNVDDSSSFYALFPPPGGISSGGSASWASSSIYSLTASYVSGSQNSETASYLSGSGVGIFSGSFFGTSSFTISSSLAIQAVSANFADYAQYAETSSLAQLAVAANFADYAQYAETASYLLGGVTSASYAATSSYTLYSIVPDDTALDNIPTAARFLGMVSYVIADNQFYQLIGGTSNPFWTPIPISASYASQSFMAVSASYAMNGGGGGGGTVNLSGLNNYIPFWWNNNLTTGSLIYADPYNIGINTPYPSANDTFTVTAVSASNVLWTPTLLSVPARFWYKADSVTVLSGSSASLWPDASPYQNYATASASNVQPLLVYNQLNGYPAVRFNGVNSQLKCISPTSVTASAVTAFVVAKVASYPNAVSPSNVGTIIGNSHSGNSKNIVIGEYYDGISSFYWSVYTENTTTNYNQVTPASGHALTNFWYINTVVVNGVTSTTTLYSGSTAYGSGTSNESTNLDLRDLYIGYETGSNQPFNGDIAEIIVVTQSMSTGDQQKVEGYLAWKYGLQANLPGAHPYKSTMPTPGGGGNIQVWKDFNNNVLAYLSASGILYVTASYAITSSWSSIAFNASNSISASFASQSISSSFAQSASWAPAAASDYSISASFASQSISSSFATTASYATNANPNAISASWASQSYFALTASFASRSFFATTSSWASASISSSYASQSFLAVSASYATNANPNAISASFASQSISASFATTASYATNANPNAISASWASASISASFATTASYATNANPNAISASFASQSISASFATTASYATNANPNAISASWASASLSASYLSGSHIGPTSGSVFGTASWANSSSYATTASYAANANPNAISASFASQSISASYAQSASWAPSAGLTGTNNYIPIWLNNGLTSTSSIYDIVGSGVGINATSSQINAALTVQALPTSSSILWTPVYLSGYATSSIQLWLRADDISGSNSSSVGYWVDTGSYGNYFTQSNAGLQPFFVTTSLNSHSYVHFNGGATNVRMQSVSGSTSIPLASLNFFAVVNPWSYPVSVQSYSTADVLGNGHSGNSKDFAIGPRNYSSTKQWSMYNESNAAAYDIDAAASVSQSWYVVNGNVNGALSILTLYLNGAATSSGYVVGSTGVDLHDLFIGYEPSYGVPFQGDIAEIIVTPQVLSSTDQSKVEGYLAWKYGIQSVLPSNHQYANSAPYLLNAGIVQTWQDINSNIVSYVSASGLYVGTASYAYNSISASWSPPSGVTAYAVSASWASQSFWAVSSSFASSSVSASYLSGTHIGPTSGSLFGTASWASNVISSSFASASGFSNFATSASWASASLTSSYNPTSSFSFYAQTASAITPSNVYDRVDLTGSLYNAGTLPSNRGNLITAIVGNTIYIMGGWSTGTAHNNIWTASTDNPNLVGDSLATLPGNCHSAKCLNINGTLYIWGGFTGTPTGGLTALQTIFTASAASPLVWGTSTNTVPNGLASYDCMYSGSVVYFFFGYNTSSYNYSIYTASFSSPDVIGVATSSLSFGLYQNTTIQLNNTLYGIAGVCSLDGAFSYNSRIFSSSLSNAVKGWGTAASGLTWEGGTTPVLGIGEKIYVFGGYIGGSSIANNIYSLAAPLYTTPVNTGWTIPFSSHYHVGMVVTTSLNYPYVVLYGGGTGNSSDGANYIFTASLLDTINISTQSMVNWTYNIPNKTLGTLNGISTTVQPISASYAVSSSTTLFALTSSFVVTSSLSYNSYAAISASWASSSISSSFLNGIATASLFGTSSWAVSASNAISASWAPVGVSSVATSASWASQSLSASWAPVPVSASWSSASLTSSYSFTASFALNAGGSGIVSASISSSFASQSFSATSASWASSSLTSSFSSTASVAINAATSSTTLTASYFYSQSGSGAWRIYVDQLSGNLTFNYF